MPKRKHAADIDPTETVHFRPGTWLGQQVIRWARTWDLSRGAAAKRLTAMAAIGLSVDAYDDVVELSQYTAGDFDDALKLVQVEILSTEQQKSGRAKNASSKRDLQERNDAVRVVCVRYRMVRAAFYTEVEEPQKVHVTRGQGE